MTSKGRQVAVVGVGETTYYKQGQAPVPEFLLAVEAIERACADAGLAPRMLDGFFSYAEERSTPARLGTALALPDIAYASMVWGGGGGGVCAAVGAAAAALMAGSCRYAVVYRSLAQGQFGRFGRGRPIPEVRGRYAYLMPHGVFAPVHQVALRTRRFMHEHGVTEDALCAVALAANAHAQRNPRAVMHGRPLTREAYYEARMIAEPFRLFDCCLENDGGAAVVLTTAERARDGRARPAFLLAAAQGSGPRFELESHNHDPYASANFTTVAPRLYAEAGVGPEDIDVAQIYENFTGAVVMALVEHGFCAPDEASAFCTAENFSFAGGRLPLNTSGGNLAECYMHGLELVIEAVRQIRGTSTAQVAGAELALVAGGPVTSPVSDLILSA